jgi:hypothetical protein
MLKAAFNPKVYKVERPKRHHSYLVAPNGDWLASADGSSTAAQGWVDDNALWEPTKGGFRHVASGLKLKARRSDAGVELSLAGEAIGADGAPGAAAATFEVGHGPERLPSEYLAEMKAQGWVALACILPPDVLDGLQRLGGVDAYEGAEMDRARQLALDPAMARSIVEPLSLWLCRQYMRVQDIKLGHPPSVTALTPDDGERPVQGWHSDFPYMWGSERQRPGAYRVPPGRDELCLALQRNICVSDFRLDNGATVFRLASHDAYALPPEDWGRAVRTYRPGDRQQNGLPYGGEETDVIEAPAGTILLYDARIWHRAGINMTNRRRGAVIQAVTPGYVIPFMPMNESYRTWRTSDVPAQMTQRERREMENLFVHRISGPMGLFALGQDNQLTEEIRAGGARGSGY